MLLDTADLQANLRRGFWMWLALLAIIALALLAWGDASLVAGLRAIPWVKAGKKALKFLSHFGLAPFYVAFLWLLWAGRRQSRRDWWTLATGYWIAQGTGLVVVQSLKMLLGRARPNHALQDPAHLWIGPTLNPGYYSFPSGHMADLMISAFFLIVLLKRRWTAPALLAYALLMGMSRMAINSHFPTDLLVGTLLGGVIAMATLQRWVAPRL